MQLKLIALIHCFTLFSVYASELQLKKFRLEPSPSKNNIFPLPGLPIKLQLHVASFIKEPIIGQTVKKIKAYLLTDKQKSRFLADDTFTRNLLVHLQERDHHSMLELATCMASPASKKVAHHLRQEGEKCWQEFLSAKTKDVYSKFVFKKHTDARLMPSLLYFILSNKHNHEQALNGINEASYLITDSICIFHYKQNTSLIYGLQAGF